MSYYVIKNETGSDILLEDIGVRLSGLGSTANVDAAAFESSASVRAAGRSISSKLVREYAVWPLSRPRRPAGPQPASVTVQTHYVPQSHAAPAPMSPDIGAKLDGLISAVASLLSSGHVKTQSADQDRPPVHESRVQQAQKAPEDPVFIPSSIVPVGASVNVRLNTSEADRPDIEESADALRNLRRKKK